MNNPYEIQSLDGLRSPRCACAPAVGQAGAARPAHSQLPPLKHSLNPAAWLPAAATTLRGGIERQKNCHTHPHTHTSPSTAKTGHSAGGYQADSRPPHLSCCTAREIKGLTSRSPILHTLSLYVVLSRTPIASLPPHP